jgi:hypothetical protein
MFAAAVSALPRADAPAGKFTGRDLPDADVLWKLKSELALSGHDRPVTTFVVPPKADLSGLNLSTSITLMVPKRP